MGKQASSKEREGTMGDVRRRLCAMGLAVLGCNYDATSQGDGPGTTAGTSSGGGEVGESTKGGAEGSSTTAVAEGSGSSGSSGGSGSTGETSSGSGDSTTGEPLPTARSCAEVRDEDRQAQTGVHPIVSTSDGTVVEVWCDMEVDGGGWTLVARSANGGNGAFGWGVARGEMEDITQPYSLDVMSLGMPFSEILVGERSGWAAVVENAYVITVPDGFIEDYREEPYETDTPRTVLGDCEPSGGPEMLRWIGYTEDDENYFFRDFSDNHNWGLYPHEWRMAYDDCDRGGWLDDAQGAVFVR
jgi:hypothetical protein